ILGLRGPEPGQLNIPSQSNRGPSLRDPGRLPLLVAVVSLVTVVAFESLAISTVMPIVESDLGEIQLYGWVFSSFYIGTLIGVVVGGNAVDRIKPIGPMMVGVAIFMAGLLIGGFAPSMEVLVAGRLLQGLGAGVVPAVSYVAVARGFPESLHPKVFAAMSTAWIMPALISPLLASIIAKHVGWRWVFLGLIPITAVVAAIGAPAVSKVDGSPKRLAGSTEVGRTSPVQTVMVLAIAATMTLVGLGLENPFVALPLAAVGLAAMVPAFRRLTPPGTLTARPRLPAAILIRGLLTFAFFSSDAFLSLAVTSVRHRTTTYAGMALVGSSVAWTVGSWVQARYLSIGTPGRWKSTHLVRTGGLLLLAGASGMVASLSQRVPIGMWVASSATMGLGMGLAYTTISVVTLSEAEEGSEGSATSSMQMSDILGIALGTGLAGVMVSIGDRFDAANATALAGVFASSAAMALLVAALAPRLSKPLSPL
ncbi:MAG TPA: MFS transporter, partial [Microthrixaceae bacterium]|nr:MFS transporter [Microthrixaceae bacterium]